VWGKEGHEGQGDRFEAGKKKVAPQNLGNEAPSDVIPRGLRVCGTMGRPMAAQDAKKGRVVDRQPFAFSRVASC
jgi:hypothetical protein